MTTWITDDRGNRCSVEHFGSEDAARRALESNENCRNCENCKDCVSCNNCRNCEGCVACEGCVHCWYCRNSWYCTHCEDCRDCKACAACNNCRNCEGCMDCKNCTDCRGCFSVDAVVSPLVVGPVRSDGYQFVMGASRSIHAGCRVFVSLSEARAHWLSDDYDKPELKAETARILDHIEAASKG